VIITPTSYLVTSVSVAGLATSGTGALASRICDSNCLATSGFCFRKSRAFSLPPVKLEEAIIRVKNEGKLNLKGIIPVDLFGQAADYDVINKIAKKYGLFVLEDAAQSFGGSYKNRKNCSLADVAATSFFPAKPLGCYGDGGMIFLNNIEISEKLLSIRVHGQGTDKYDNIRIGINGRIDSMQCAVLLAKMEIFNEEIELRQEVAGYYSKGLKDVVKVPYIHDYNISAWAQYSVLHPEREKIIKKLNEAGIPVAIYYPKPLHLQEAFKNLGYKYGDFPVSEKMSNEIFSLPFYPYLKKEIQDEIIKSVISFKK